MSASTWWHWDDGVQIYNYSDMGKGWTNYHGECSGCKRDIISVAPVGSYGFECPWCGAVDMAHEWPGIEDILH